MSDLLLRFYVWQHVFRANYRTTLVRDERGEGVISAAIAVLIMAFLGVAVWIGFKATLGDSQKRVDDQVQQIGQ